MASKASSVEKLGEVPRVLEVRPIDLVHLAGQCLGDDNLEREVLRLFDTTIETYFGRVQQAVSAEELALNLHSVKGAASGVGAWTIADLAKAAEHEMQAGRPLSPERIADLGLAVEEVRAFIAQILDKGQD